MTKKTVLLFIISTAIIMFYSCKKNETSAPVITITAPYQGQIVTLGQPINVVATINYSSSLQFARMTLINTNYISVDVMESIAITGSPMNINTTYTITNSSLTSGSYYLQLTASDGTNQVSGYSQININVPATITKAVYVVTGSNNAHTTVWKVDSTNNISQVIPLGGDFSNAAISSADQCLYTTGIYSGNFNCINLTNNSLNFYVPAVNNGFPTFERVYSNNKKNFLAEYDNVIHGYDLYGNSNYTANTLSGTYPFNMYSDNQYLYAEQREIASSDVTLNVYYLPNGVLFQNIVVNEDIVAMFSISTDSLMLFTNSNGIGKALIYNIPNNMTTTAITLPSQQLFSAVKISNIAYLLGMQNQVYLYTTNSLGHVGAVLPISAATAMKYDSLTNKIFIADAKNLDIYNSNTLTLETTIPFTDTLKDIAILHSR